jgi:hypothetical protein
MPTLEKLPADYGMGGMMTSAIQRYSVVGTESSFAGRFGKFEISITFWLCGAGIS